MNNIIKYQNWPQIVKITTAFVHKRFFSRSPTFSYVVGYLCLIGGIIGLAYAYTKQYPLIAENYFANLCYIILGIACIISGNSIKWIASNSTWEERFQNKSSLSVKVIYILITALLLACALGIILM